MDWNRSCLPDKFAVLTGWLKSASKKLREENFDFVCSLESLINLQGKGHFCSSLNENYSSLQA